MILLGSKYVFWDGETGDVVPVENLPSDLNDLTEDTKYLIGDTVYDYVGICPNALALKKSYPNGGAFGRLASNPERFVFIDYLTEEEARKYVATNIITEQMYDNMTTLGTHVRAASTIIEQYFQTIRDGGNAASKIQQKPNREGFPYVPEFRPEDDPLERLLKVTVASMQIVSSESRNKMDKDYEFDNLVSTFDGMTKHTSIDKIMDWCNFLKLEWEFSVFQVEEHDWQLAEELSVTSSNMPWVSIDDSNQKEVFKVALVDGEDPLKRLVKLFLDKMSCPSLYYHNRGSSPHLVNNMKSALKRKQKMTMKYFINWCNLLGLGFGFRFTRPDGIWYKTIGYTVDTNDPDGYAMGLIADIIPAEDGEESEG